MAEGFLITLWHRCCSPLFIQYIAKEFHIRLTSVPAFVGLYVEQMDEGDPEQGILSAPAVGLWEVDDSGFRQISFGERIRNDVEQIRSGEWLFYKRPIIRFYLADNVIITSEIYGQDIRLRKVYRLSPSDLKTVIDERTVWANDPLPQ